LFAVATFKHYKEFSKLLPEKVVQPEGAISSSLPGSRLNACGVNLFAGGMGFKLEAHT
jgi:hypothetical protein